MGARKVLSDLDLNAGLLLTKYLSATLAGNVNDYAPTDADISTVWRLTSSTTERYISGIAGGVAGRIIFLVNVGIASTGRGVGLQDESTSSVAANRIRTPGGSGGGYMMAPGDIVMLWYDGVDSRWKLMGGLNQSSFYHANPTTNLYTNGNMQIGSTGGLLAIHAIQLIFRIEATYGLEEQTIIARGDGTNTARWAGPGHMRSASSATATVETGRSLIVSRKYEILANAALEITANASLEIT